MEKSGHVTKGRILAAAAIGVVAAGTAVLPLATAASAGTAAGVHHKPPHPSRHKTAMITSTGLKKGDIKHVWLIILENKSYDATFTGLNQNSYLWKTLPKQGALLTNYYGTGHSSMDNYLSLVSGQAPEEDTQEDCSVEANNFSDDSHIVHKGNLHTDKNYGQAESLANSSQPSGANAPNGANGCVYPKDVPTLFNQLDAAHETWKGYAQDLHNQPGREDGRCGYPGTSANNPDTNPTFLTATPSNPLPPGVTSFTGAQPNDQYVAKHFPFAWFHSLTGTTNADGSVSPGLTTPAQGGNDCDAAHIANLDDPQHGLVHDLESTKTTPAFSWITPNNCSDAHDAICKGNNLSGAFDAHGNPIYNSPTPYDPSSTSPKNYTGGLYASDLFLKYYVPLIEESQAFKHGGLIDITFDEGFPPFTYTGNSFNNANAYGPTDQDQPNASSSLTSDAAGENRYGHNIHKEPTGPNSTLGTNQAGDELYPGPGNNAFIDRPPACTSTDPDVPADCVPGIVRGGAGSPPPARTDSVSGGTSSSFIEDKAILADDTGREVTDTTDPGSPIPANTFVGAVSDTGPYFPTSSSGQVTNGAFQLVDQGGNPVTPTGNVTSITLSAEGDPGDLQAGQTADPLWDAKDPTPGGGDTGSVLISPFIKPGTVSNVFYNHYSWLRTMEDIFGVDKGKDHAKLPAGTVSGGLDGKGHLGYAAQPGLRPFGRDVFSNPHGTTEVAHHANATGARLESGLGFGGAAVIAMLFLWRRTERRRHRLAA